MSRWTRRRRAAGLPLGEKLLTALPFTQEDRRTLEALHTREKRPSLRLRRRSV